MMMRRTDTRTDTDRQPYSVKRAADATGKTKPTILRAIQANRIAARKDEHGRWQIEPAELHRVYRSLVAVHRTDTCTDARAAPGEAHIELLRGILDELRRLTGMLTDQPTPAGEPAAAPATGPAMAAAAPIGNTTETRETPSAPAAKDSDSAALARSAQQAFESGRLAEADTLLDLAGKAELAARDRHALRAAKLIADRGEIALRQLRYADAAEYFKQAAALVPDGHPAQSADYLEGQAEAVCREGSEWGDNAALNRSIEIWRTVLRYRPRDRVPLAWAMTQNSLGAVLCTLGSRETRTTRLIEAVATFRAALEELTRDRAPLDWAATQHGLGNVLVRLGEREAGAAHLTQAVAAYQAALEERKRDRLPVDWAMTTGNQGIALMLLAQRLGDANRARLAVQQIEMASVTMRDHGNAALAADYIRQALKAQAVLRQLSRR
jgi:tetratricopeptide (TPR) repeat protein